MALPKDIESSERARALDAIARLDTIPVGDRDRKGSETVFSHARIVSEVRSALADPLIAFEVVRALTAEGIVGKSRPVRIVSADGAVRTTKASFVNLGLALDAISNESA